VKLKSVVVSWDFGVAVALALAGAILLEPRLLNAFAKDLYAIGISVLSIVFSVFFAALAIIISSSDDDFVRFLEEDGGYTHLVATFRWTLAALFTALIYSLGAYGLTARGALVDKSTQPKHWVLIFGFLFSYSLLATYLSTRDAIAYAQRRTRFLSLKRRDGKPQS
jgi:hypothetical protein